MNSGAILLALLSIINVSDRDRVEYVRHNGKIYYVISEEGLEEVLHPGIRIISTDFPNDPDTLERHIRRNNIVVIKRYVVMRSGKVQEYAVLALLDIKGVKTL